MVIITSSSRSLCHMGSSPRDSSDGRFHSMPSGDKALGKAGKPSGSSNGSSDCHTVPSTVSSTKAGKACSLVRCESLGSGLTSNFALHNNAQSHPTKAKG